MRSAFAPGRLNLIGEHIDYSGGRVMPFPLPLGTRASGKRSVRLDVASAGFGGRARLAAGQRGRGWARYLAAAWEEVRLARPGTGGWTGRVEGDLPTGAGLSSSASFLVCALRLWDRLYGLDFRETDIAAMAWRAETQGLGKPVGPMDPFAIALGRPGHVLLFDCAALRGRQVRLPAAAWIAFHSGVRRSLDRSGYAARRAQCERAASVLGVRRLAEARPGDLARLDGVLLRRARHVVGECARVAAAERAMKRRDAAALGRLLVRSHASLRDDFDVSLPEVDRQVEAALAAGALGARMVGGGFGGAILTLWEKEDPRATDFARGQRGVFWSNL